MEAEGILSRSRADAEGLREELRQKAIADSAAIVKRAEKEIQLETNRAVEQLRREAVELSLAIATKLLQRNVTKDDNAALIDETIWQIDGSSTDDGSGFRCRSSGVLGFRGSEAPVCLTAVLRT